MLINTGSFVTCVCALIESHFNYLHKDNFTTCYRHRAIPEISRNVFQHFYFRNSKCTFTKLFYEFLENINPFTTSTMFPDINVISKFKSPITQ